MNNFSV